MKLFHRTVSAFCAAALALCAGISASAAVKISDGTYEYTYRDGEWQLYSYIGDDSEITLPQTFADEPVTKICNECFSNSGVTKITIPEGYTEIGNYAFYNCADLYEVSFPSTLAEIGMGAFANSGVEQADLSETKITAADHYLFLNCANLKSVSLPKTVSIIGESAFARSGITEIDIPKSVTALGSSAFANTSALETVSLHNGLKSIEESCFEGSAVSKIELPETTETIGASAFRNSGLTEIYLPDSLSYIGGYALFPMSIQGTVEAVYFSDSYAEQYCYENFVMSTRSYDKYYGDANLDGAINVDDVTAIQRHCAEIDLLSAPARALADTNHNGGVDVSDVTLLQRYIAQFDDAII